jgi:hypothetical protein
VKHFSFLNKKLQSIALAACLVLAFASTAAATTINFDQAGLSGGTINYSGNLGDSLFGTGIVFGTLGAFGTGNDGVYTCSGCILNFETGASNAQLGASGLNIGASVQFDPGGSFVLTGEVLDNDDNVINTSSNVILQGVFDFATVIKTGSNSLGFLASGSDVKNQQILDFLGITIPNFTFVNSAFSLGGGLTENFAITGASVVEADLTNSASAIPEPSTLLLSGLALLGLGLLRRRQAKA